MTIDPSKIEKSMQEKKEAPLSLADCQRYMENLLKVESHRFRPTGQGQSQGEVKATANTLDSLKQKKSLLRISRSEEQQTPPDNITLLKNSKHSD